MCLSHGQSTAQRDHHLVIALPIRPYIRSMSAVVRQKERRLKIQDILRLERRKSLGDRAAFLFRRSANVVLRPRAFSKQLGFLVIKSTRTTEKACYSIYLEKEVKAAFDARHNQDTTENQDPINLMTLSCYQTFEAKLNIFQRLLGSEICSV